VGLGQHGAGKQPAVKQVSPLSTALREWVAGPALAETTAAGASQQAEAPSHPPTHTKTNNQPLMAIRVAENGHHRCSCLLEQDQHLATVLLLTSMSCSSGVCFSYAIFKAALEEVSTQIRLISQLQALPDGLSTVQGDCR
jgi:hypothetical protein